MKKMIEQKGKGGREGGGYRVVLVVVLVVLFCVMLCYVVLCRDVVL
jgi:hypothetical protein